MSRVHGTVTPFALLVASLWCIVLLVASGAVAQPKFPPLTGRVVDDAGLLSAADRGALDAELQALEQKSTDQIVVYTTPSLQGYAIDDYGYQLGRAWGIGQQGTNNGVILLVAPNERKVRIEVGRGLEPQLTDLMSSLIIQNTILPAFRRGDFAGGIKAGVTDIRDVLLGDADAVKQRVLTSQKRQPGGDTLSLALLLFLIAVAFMMVWMQAQQNARRGQASRYGSRYQRSGYTPAPIIIPGGWGSYGGWGGGGGGGFSGGGGDFGGGGASGSW